MVKLSVTPPSPLKVESAITSLEKTWQEPFVAFQDWAEQVVEAQQSFEEGGD